MGKGHGRLWYQLRHLGSYFHNLVHAVKHIINLPAPGQFPVDGLTDNFLIIFHHVCLDRKTVHRRLLQHAHITDADQAHMKRPRNWGGRQRQHIHIFLQLLDFLLVGYAKPLLLVNHQKPQILKFHILGKNAVGTNHNIHQAAL